MSATAEVLPPSNLQCIVQCSSPARMLLSLSECAAQVEATVFGTIVAADAVHDNVWQLPW